MRKKEKQVQHIFINKNETIRQIQEKFNSCFPYLKIEFFREPTVRGKGTSRQKMYQDNLALKNLMKVKKSAEIKVDQEMKVRELESVFFNEFGLYIQLFRKSGNIWLETSATDEWTLEQQNEEGKSLAEDIKTERENPQDHDMY